MSSNVEQLRGSQYSAEEWEIRVNLAALHRLYVHFGWTDLIYTHLTARMPDNPQHYLIKPDHLLMDEICASNLIVVDMDGNLIAGEDPPNEAGHLIHTAVLAARPDINFAAHTHSRAGAAVSCMACGLLPLSQHANGILPTVSYHDYQDVTNAEDECAALARDLGDKFLMLMRNHGILAVGRTIEECFFYLYFLEMACKIQVDVLASGQDMVLASDEIVDGLFTGSGAPEQSPAGSRMWPAMLRLLDRKDSSFRD